MPLSVACVPLSPARLFVGQVPTSLSPPSILALSFLSGLFPLIPAKSYALYGVSLRVSYYIYCTLVRASTAGVLARLLSLIAFQVTQNAVFSIILLLVLLSTISCTPTPQDRDMLAPNITSTTGAISGFPPDANGSLAFKGIPYAAPPIGELCWAPPRHPEPWEGVLDAKKFGPLYWQALYTAWNAGEKWGLSQNQRMDWCFGGGRETSCHGLDTWR